MILPPGQLHPARGDGRLTRRERWILTIVLGVVTALVVAIVISLTIGGHRSRNGCVDVTIPYSFGGQEVYRCGAAARALCAAVGAPGGYSGQAAGAVARECRKAKLPVGR